MVYLLVPKSSRYIYRKSQQILGYTYYQNVEESIIPLMGGIFGLLYLSPNIHHKKESIHLLGCFFKVIETVIVLDSFKDRSNVYGDEDEKDEEESGEQ